MNPIGKGTTDRGHLDIQVIVEDPDTFVRP
jgi:hypothetical protein